jgi:hypothetical protein
MKTSRAPQAKIVNHDSGMGAPDNGTVRRRATELALIDGRSAFNEEDWRQAKRELHGGHPQDEEEGVNSGFESVSERDMISANAGHQVENVPLDDAVNIVEELIVEGMDEAVHEQMLESSKLEKRKED